MGKSPQRKSRKVLCLITWTSSTQQERGDPYVDQNPHTVACWCLLKLKKIKQERWNPQRWRSTTLTSEHQDCHMQLWMKQNISELKSLSKRSKVILIEKHFNPTCSRITCTTHSTAIRERWSANWVMWSCSSCAKLYKSTMFSLSSLLESRNCVVLHLQTILDRQRIQKKVWQTKTGCTLYPELRDKERTQSWCLTSQNRRTKREYQKSLECMEEMLEESWLSRWTFYRYSRSISLRSSVSWITTRNRMDRTKVQRVGRTCKRRTYIPSHQRKREDTKDNGTPFWTNQAKMGLRNFDPIFELLSLWKIACTTSQANKLKSLFLQNNTGFKHIVVGQVWMELEMSS